MPSVISVPTNSYVTLAETDTYHDDSIHGYETWEDTDDDDKTRALLTAFRVIERQDYKGTPTGSQKWPRSGLTDEDDNPISDASVPEFVERAQMELALELIENPSVQTDSDTRDNTKRLKAGTVAITKFRPISGTRFPVIINEYLGRYIEGQFDLSLPVAGGTDTESGLETYGLNWGL